MVITLQKTRATFIPLMPFVKKKTTHLARVFSIFEGEEETLILRVVARQLLEDALK